MLVGGLDGMPMAVGSRRSAEAGQRATTSAKEDAALAATMVTSRSIASDVRRRKEA